jgi:hypothetical protein
MPVLRVIALLSALAVAPVGVPTAPPPTSTEAMPPPAPQLFDPARSQARF